MPTSEYELWDTYGGEMIISTFDKENLIDALELVMDQSRLAERLDNLSLIVYHADMQTEVFDGAEEIDKWLTENK